MRLDFDTFTAREILEVEAACGQQVTSMADGNVSIGAMAALHWIAKRREDPEWTHDQSLDLPLGELAAMFEDEPEDPTPPA